jgi:uncharacterized protein (TIGR04255 family)
LQNQPLLKVHWDGNFAILVGDTSLAVACNMPYPGWNNFKSHITELIEILHERPFIQEIERFSLKYTSVVEGRDLAEQIGRIRIELKLGDYVLNAEPFSARIEMRREPFLHIVNLAASAITNFPDGSQRTGVLIDIDCICEHKTTDLDTFFAQLPDRVEGLHTHNKELFFGLLTPETLAYLEPIYEPVS